MSDNMSKRMIGETLEIFERALHATHANIEGADPRAEEYPHLKLIADTYQKLVDVLEEGVAKADEL